MKRKTRWNREFKKESKEHPSLGPKLVNIIVSDHMRAEMLAKRRKR
jgi:hypothetical protein